MRLSFHVLGELATIVPARLVGMPGQLVTLAGRRPVGPPNCLGVIVATQVVNPVVVNSVSEASVTYAWVLWSPTPDSNLRWDHRGLSRPIRQVGWQAKVYT